MFADLVGPGSSSQVEAGWLAAWEHPDPVNVLVWVYRFDTAEHARQVWDQLATLESDDADGVDRYTFDGIDDTHARALATSDQDSFAVHEAYRLLGRHLFTFVLTEGSATQRPDPTLEQVVRDHHSRYPADPEDD